MPKMKPYLIPDVSEGILQGVGSSIVPKNSVYLAVNLVFHKKLGYAVARDGRETLGDDVGSSCNGLHHFIKTNGDKKLLGAFSTNIYSLETGTWTSRTAIANSDVRFLTFSNTVLALDGTNKKSSTDGESWVTTGGNLDLDNMPLGKYALNWQDKIYLAGVSGNPDRVYFSSIYDDGTISWTADTAGNMDVDPEDGAGGIVGLAKVPGYLLIFKERSLHRWNGKTLFPESLMNVGTQSQESMTLAREALYFWNERGVFKTNGGYPQKISRRIQDIIDEVSSNVCAWSDSEMVYFSIGDITLDGLSLTNCVIVFHIDTQTWTLFSYGSNIVKMHRYIDGTEKVIAGDSGGQVWILNQGSENIEYHLQTQNIETGYRSRIKDISQVIVFTRKIKSGTLLAKSEEKDYKTLGNIDKDISVINNDLSGRYMDFRISGIDKSGVEIKGLELSELSINSSKEQ